MPDQLRRATDSPAPAPSETEAERRAAELSADLKVHQIELEMQNQELREMQVSLEVSRQRYFSLFDLAPVPYVIFTERQIVEEMNLVAAELLGGTRRDFVKRTFTLHLAEESRPLFHEHLRGVFTGESGAQSELRLLSRGGRLRHVAVRSTMLPGDGERGRLALTAFVDVTTEREAEARQKHLEAELRQSQKMEALGLLAGGMAHDFNNILQVISGFGDLALHQATDDGVRESIQQVLHAADRAAQLTRQILAFGSRQAIETRVVSLNEVVLALSPMLSRLVRSDLEIRTVLESGLPPVLADRGQIEQVLMNLVINARDAMREAAGTIEITTGWMPQALTPRNAQSNVRDASAVIVRDTGIGMAPEVLARIFEPFFTTKPRARGTGLGLSVVHGIVQQHGGEIRVESRVGVGTTFTILLPSSQGAVAPPPPPPSTVTGAGQWILMAEDEPALRDLNKAMLERLGYRVLSARDGAHAVEQYRQHRGEPIALLLFDVIMPRLSGLEAYRAICESGSFPPVLFVSGFPGDAPIEPSSAEGVWFLRKPFREADLRLKVAACLGAAPA